MNFVALDLETANADLASICQIGIAKFKDGEIIEEVSSYIDPKDFFHPINVAIHGITEDDVVGAPTFVDFADNLSSILSAPTICVTHTHFDRSAIHQACAKHSLDFPTCRWLDTARVARRSWSSVAQKGYGLANLAAMLGIQFNHHDALEDAKAAGLILCEAVRHSSISVEDWMQRVENPISGIPHGEEIKREGNPDGPLFGEVVCFTGALAIPRKEAAQLAAELGCGVKPGVSKKVTLLVVGDQDITKLGGNEISSKHRKALELIEKGCPIRILKETDFRALTNLQT
jgi:DNA polymerase-3 subunit epsilon